MTYQEKQALITEGVTTISQGTSWDDWQAQLTNQGMYQKDIDLTGLKVIAAIDDKYGDPVQAQLESTGEAQPVDGLHPNVFSRIVARRTVNVKGKLANQISKELLAGAEPKTLLLKYAQNPLVDEQTLKKAVNKARAKAEVQQEKAANASPVSLILGLVFMLGGLGLTMASDGQAIFYGAILVGGGMILRYIIEVAS